MPKPDLPILKSGQRARLIPSISDSKKEERATSSLLATFTVVGGFAERVLRSVGAPISKRASVECYTEVVLATKDQKSARPDGLIQVTSRGKTWTALVEAKVGNSQLRQDQIEDYLDRARELKLDAVITLSNQFAPLPTHHPLMLPKSKTRTVNLYHFSWLSIASEAIMLADSKGVEDPEQAYILSELVRYLQHPGSGVATLKSMGPGWRKTCEEVQRGMTLRPNAEHVKETVSSWHQLKRYLAIQLSVAVGKPVTIAMSRARKLDPAANFTQDCEYLVKSQCLTTEFEVPDAAAKLQFLVDFRRRTLNFAMRLDPPRDKKRPVAAVNWLTRQLKDFEESNLLVRADWPRRIPTTTASLSRALNAPQDLIPENVSDLPNKLEVARIIDLAGKFRGGTKFVEEAEVALKDYYRVTGQQLKPWAPKPPKLKEPAREILPDEDEASVGSPGCAPRAENESA